GLPGRGGQGGMPEREGAEPLRERYLRGVVEALVAQEDHLVLQQCLAYLGDGLVVRRRGGSDAGDDGPDLAGQRRDVNASGCSSGITHSSALSRLAEPGGHAGGLLR